jgi:transposase
MRNVTRLGIDLAKHVFQLHGVDDRGHTVLRRQISRAQLRACCAHLRPCLIGMEACGSAHHWARELRTLGHDVRLIAPQFVPGVGPVTATALVATVGDARAFKNGRQLAAWLGLVPRQHSSGGTRRLGRITKRGDVYLRTLLIHGARAVMRQLARRTDATSRWVLALQARRGFNKAVVALAAKQARVLWALLATGRPYEPAAACP